MEQQQELDMVKTDRGVMLTEWECDILVKAMVAVNHAGSHVKLSAKLMEKLENGLNPKPTD